MMDIVGEISLLLAVDPLCGGRVSSETVERIAALVAAVPPAPVASDPPVADPGLPPGQYAIAELMGHRTLIGRIEEVERFGTRLLSIEPIYGDALLPAIVVGGSSIYALTPCTAAVARARQAKREWDLPVSLRATLPQAALPAPDDEDHFGFADAGDEEVF